jgi:hypothetical protein
LSIAPIVVSIHSITKSGIPLVPHGWILAVLTLVTTCAMRPAIMSLTTASTIIVGVEISLRVVVASIEIVVASIITISVSVVIVVTAIVAIVPIGLVVVER